MSFCEGFSHLVLPVADLDRWEKFYQGVFGLELLGRDLVSEKGPNAVLKSDSRQMVILVQVPAEEVKIEREGANSTHHAWLVDTPAEYKAIEQRLKGMGFDISDYRADFRALGQYSVDLVDPDGHRWQIQAQGPEATEVRFERAGIVDCGSAEGYAIGEVKLFEEHKFFLLRVEEGFLAFSQWCTHQNGLVRWRGSFYDFYCPKHGASFTRLGKCTSPLMRLPPLRLHPLRITETGSIEVDTDRVLLRRVHSPEQIVPLACGSRLEVKALKNVREVV
jgi:catechol 2,3-dioxygenase-like lactoylglutathione lyase family enzyme/nitrite reductase/ring-hydroxylating ferredoxin subunit